MKRLGVLAAWIIATVASVGIAYAAVGNVRGRVSDPPLPRVNLAVGRLDQLDDATSTTLASVLVPTTFAEPSVDTTLTASSSSASTGSEPPETTPPTTPPPSTEPPATQPTTTAPPPTTAPPVTGDIQTYNTRGGWVTVRVGDGTVDLEGAGPYAGYSVKVESSGPKTVKVEFRSRHDEVTFKAEFEGGKLHTETD